MWRIYWGFMAIDRGWNAWENFISGDKHKRFIKFFLDLAGMCVAICIICGKDDWAKPFQGKPPL